MWQFEYFRGKIEITGHGNIRLLMLVIKSITFLNVILKMPDDISVVKKRKERKKSYKFWKQIV